ncbi:MAG: adenylosuccinate lyase [Oscillospiraceae bacterium]|nr:adenylosuccinate lyase [Oscillospiraceae bacterium]
MKDIYENPLISRYASRDMLALFSPDRKFQTWRRLWLALARAERALGLPISEAQIAEMEAHQTDVDYERAAYWEKRLRHDVMAHIHAWGEQCPAAMPIIHLGATSCYVGDNTDILLLRDGLLLLRGKLVSAARALVGFAAIYKDMPTLGFTHFQPAQLTTVGKRATLWLQELLMDLDELEYRLTTLKLLGSKGTTGTQASFLALFDGDHGKARRLEELIAAELGFDGVVPVSGQTYSRKLDAGVLATLSGIAQSASKFATDLRLLSHLKEIEEPFEGGQVGSSAMPYKRNPMRSERICALARYVMADALNPAFTAAGQWFERTLDDSANKRLSVPEAFLAADAILDIYRNVARGMTVYPSVIDKHIREELPFMATENILMNAVRRGGDRQELHERIRAHSLEAGRTVKEKGLPNDLVSRIAGDPAFGLTERDIEETLQPERFVGRAPEQVTEYLEEIVNPLLAQYPADGAGEELKV